MFTVDITWLCYLSLVIAGGLFALGAFAAELSLDDNDVANMYLAAWAMYAISSFIDVILSITNLYQQEKSLEKTAENMKVSLLEKASNFLSIESSTDALPSSI